MSERVVSISQCPSPDLDDQVLGGISSGTLEVLEMHKNVLITCKINSQGGGKSRTSF